MRKYLIIFLISFVICHFIYLLMANGIKKFYIFSYDSINEIVNGNINYDALYVGSSRTQVQLNPCIIDSITHFNSFNAGNKGANSLEVRMLIEAYLTKHKAPKYIFYNIDHRAIEQIVKIPNPTLYLFFLQNDGILHGLEGNYKRLFILKYFPFTRIFYFDDYYRNIALQGYFNKNEIIRGNNYCKGHSSNTNDIIKKIISPKGEKKIKVDLTEINKIIGICIQENIKLIFHYTPDLKIDSQSKNTQKVDEIENLAIEKNISFIKLDSCKVLKQDDFFDIVHLNKSGSEKYSRLFGNEVLKLINK